MSVKLFAYWVFFTYKVFLVNTKSPFWKILSRIPPECQTVWIQIRPDILLGLIRVQNGYKNYQRTTRRCLKRTNRVIPCQTLNSFLCSCHFCCLLDNLCKQFGSRSGPTECPSWCGSILWWCSRNIFFEKVNFEKSQQTTTKAWTIAQHAKHWGSVRSGCYKGTILQRNYWKMII